jgi:hypothetical protein
MDGGAVIPVGEIDFEIIGHGLCSKRKRPALLPALYMRVAR